jgi:hypothetical protein
MLVSRMSAGRDRCGYLLIGKDLVLWRWKVSTTKGEEGEGRRGRGGGGGEEGEEVSCDIVMGEDVGGSAIDLQTLEKEEEISSEFQSEVSPSSSESQSLSYNSSHFPDESALSSPSTKKSKTGSVSSLSPACDNFNGEWQCDHSGCGRVFPKRHDLK